MLNKALKVVGIFFAVILLIVAAYVIYVFVTYHRIVDNQDLTIVVPNEQNEEYSGVDLDKEYIIGTYNVGFGAYTPDYSFFMDGGKYSRCYSKQSAIDTIKGATDLSKSYEPDFMIYQEVDLDSTKSYHENQDDIIREKFDSYYEDFAINYDSAYLFYPITCPIGKSYSGIATYSKYQITDALRRSLPITEGVNKLIDLDRCYSISRIPVNNGKELIILNVHLSAYGSDDKVREGQTSMLFEDMKKEVEKGNYVICGGDFNHDLKIDESAADSKNFESWAYPFPKSKLPEGLSFAIDKLSTEEREQLPESNRNTDIPYKEGETFVCTLDGFIISDNIDMTKYQVADTGFLYSDHQPVFMDFKLN